MTLFQQVQKLLERTYDATGVNFEECLIGAVRCRELNERAGAGAGQLSPMARTFLRVAGGRLHVAIYYHPRLIRTLEEHHPAREFGSQNIGEVIAFLEEINHAVHAGLRFLEGRLDIESEDFFRDLEFQARVDTCLILELIVGGLTGAQKLQVRERRWLRERIFGDERFEYSDPVLRERYELANRLGRRLMDHLEQLSREERLSFIKSFRFHSFSEKRSFIESLKS